MFFKNLKISSQLIFGFAAMFIFVIIIGLVSYQQSDKIQNQTETIYNYPLPFRRAISNIKIDILQMRLATRDLMIYKDEDQRQKELNILTTSAENAKQQFAILEKSYLGKKEDVESAYKAFLNWETVRNKNVQLVLNGYIDEASSNVLADGIVGQYRDIMMTKIKVIDESAINKTILLYNLSNSLSDELNVQLLVLVLVILSLIIIISFWLIRNIRNPIKELTKVTNQFKNGDLSARSDLNYKNEFGTLSTAFNSMVESIQLNHNLTENTHRLVNSMLAVENSHTFFQEMIPVLSELTNSQMVAVYLLNDDKSKYYLYESVGLSDEAARQSFDAKSFEGEFGSVLSKRKIQHVKSIPIDTTFVYNTVSGNYIPREIISIPILAENEIIAIISLASIRKYNDDVNQLILNVYNIMTARIEGLLTYRKLRKVFKRVEYQNSELEAQKTELAAQSTELREQNRELEIQKVQLNEANKLKTNFLSNMSHELRTPLNSVIALSGVLSRRLANKIGQDEYSYIDVIERNGKHLLSLINDILDISRIEAGREEIEVMRFSAENMIAELVSMIQPQAEQKNIELIQKNNNHNVFIQSDLGKCKHILQNLIANAVKFTEIGKVEITIVQHEESIEINVTDTGIGISGEHLVRVFDEFRQADSSTSRRYGGTGLGLAIAKKYANLLGGDISVQSTLEKGSTFTLVLPQNYSEENRINTESESRYDIKEIVNVQNQNDVDKTILLVDDSEPAIIQMNDFLTEMGYKTLTAKNGEEALNTISKTKPDAIILDLMMPGIDGFEVLKTIRDTDLTANIPVLILTAKHISKEELAFLERNNVHELIQKGDVNRDVLLQTVRSLFTVQQSELVKPKMNKQIIKGKPNVLIVEDNVDNMITVKAILGDNYNILEAIDGHDGVSMAKKHKPHLILMDIALPGIDGIKAFNAIRQTGELEHIPVIALTASAMTSDREIILAHGFDGYLVKPIDEKVFFETINQVLYGK